MNENPDGPLPSSATRCGGAVIVWRVLHTITALPPLFLPKSSHYQEGSRLIDEGYGVMKVEWNSHALDDIQQGKLI
ncbi:hypothetical protein EVAR_102276_1 [Eumeta japonica]|uniref:Uncharacterized protein n=1 Tax=Eumeta variegata TaxID=151549 RepID=A0A4C1WJG9_EUMVA|nr:hypothetical protein EVAR_102276_1 [Eumeta japonica]